MQMHPKPALPSPVLRAKSLMAALLLSACGTSEGLDWDMRSAGIDTSGVRPGPDVDLLEGPW